MKKKILNILLVAIIVIYPAFNISELSKKQASATDNILTRTDILEKLEKTDIRDAQNNVLQAQEKNDKLPEKDKTEILLEQLENGETTYRSVFKDVCIAGDSIMNGLESYNILNSNNLITKVSASLYHLSDNKSKIVKMSPRVLILHYGLNMLETDKGQPDRFVRFYKELISDLKQQLPDTLIIVSGIFPVNTDKVKAKRFDRIDEYNAALRAMCDELSVEFLDNGSMPEEAYSNYASDGIHLNKTFYQDYWLRYILTEKEII